MPPSPSKRGTPTRLDRECYTQCRDQLHSQSPERKTNEIQSEQDRTNKMLQIGVAGPLSDFDATTDHKQKEKLKSKIQMEGVHMSEKAPAISQEDRDLKIHDLETRRPRPEVIWPLVGLSAHASLNLRSSSSHRQLES